MAYTFDQIFAVDEANSSNVAKNASVLIFAPGDATKTPLVLTTTDGSPLANPIQVNSAGFGPAFMHATLDRVAWEGGSFGGFFTSYDGMKNEAVAARAAADSAASAAADAAALVGAPADTAVAALVGNPATDTGAALNATYARPRSLTMALLGDSITNQNSVNDYLVTDTADPLYPYNATYNGMLWRYTSGQGFWTWANAYLGHRFTLVRPLTGPNNEFGMSGKTALQLMDEGHVDNVIAAAPDYCHVMAGRNDVYSAATATSVSDRVKAIVDKLTTAGIVVVLSTILPGNTGTTAEHATVRAANSLLKAWARTKKGVILNDWYNTLVDPATGYGKAVYFADGTHPFGAGASRMGYALAKVLEPITPASPLQIDSSGLLGLAGAFQPGTTGVFSGANPAGGSGQLATGSTCYVATGVTVVASKVARTDLVPGEWQQIQQTAGTGAYNYTQRNSNVGVDFAVGETVYGVIEYETDAAGWAANQLFLTLRALPNDMRVDAAGNTSDTTLYQPVVSKGVLRTPLLTVPTGTTYLRLDATSGGGNHTVRWGRMQIYKA